MIATAIGRGNCLAVRFFVGSGRNGLFGELFRLDVVDERLDMFRDFVNSLDIDPGSSSGGSGGTSGPGGGRQGG